MEVSERIMQHIFGNIDKVGKVSIPINTTHNREKMYYENEIMYDALSIRNNTLLRIIVEGEELSYFEEIFKYLVDEIN